eukprot:8712335-Pyramimonas_sp.AAC.1
MTRIILIASQHSSGSRPSADLWIPKTNAHDDSESVTYAYQLCRFTTARVKPHIGSICEHSS